MPVENRWRPIQEANRVSDLPVDLWVANKFYPAGGYRAINAYWHTESSSPSGGHWRRKTGVDDSTHVEDRHNRVTHFMPSPPPPGCEA